MLTRTFFRVDPFAHLVEEMDRIFGGMTPMAAGPMVLDGHRTAAFPLVNVWQDDRAVYAEAELPGFALENVEILATADTLTLKGRRDLAHPEGAQVLRCERASGAFERTVALPVPIDPERVEANLSNGVLTVTLPKAPSALPRKIQVKSR